MAGFMRYLIRIAQSQAHGRSGSKLHFQPAWLGLQGSGKLLFAMIIRKAPVSFLQSDEDEGRS